jgi:5'-nucleotidase
MRVQVTNDDGVASPGINALAVAAAAEGHDVFIAAPQRDMSGMSAAIGQLHLDEHIDVQHGHLPEHPDIEVFAVAGPPALTVMAGRLGAYGDPPDLVLSGINAGLNTGRSILHSGTVGAALTASTFGASAMAVSLDAVDPWRCDTACALVRDWLPWLCEAPPGTVLNLNVPSVPLEHLRGVRWASLAQFGAVRAAVRGASRRRLQMELRAGIDDLAPDTDTVLPTRNRARAHRSSHRTGTATCSRRNGWSSGGW